jgi:hypothetical protein
MQDEGIASKLSEFKENDNLQTFVVNPNFHIRAYNKLGGINPQPEHHLKRDTKVSVVKRVISL